MLWRKLYMKNKSESDKLMDAWGGKHGVVILLDALGMQQILDTQYPKTVLRNWESLVDIIEHGFKMDCKKYKIKISVKTFFDTILITATGERLEFLTALPITLRKFLLWSMTKGFYFRGCMGYGIFFPSSSGRLVIGPAMTEAVQSYDKMNMIGIMMNPSLHNVLESRMSYDAFKKDLSPHYAKYDVPMKNGMISKQQWMLKLFPDEGIDKIVNDKTKSGVTTIVELIKKNIDEYSNKPEIKKKWENTLAFLEYCR